MARQLNAWIAHSETDASDFGRRVAATSQQTAAERQKDTASIGRHRIDSNVCGALGVYRMFGDSGGVEPCCMRFVTSRYVVVVLARAPPTRNHE